MAVLVCGGCTARFAVDLAGCPQCGSTDYKEDGSMSPKITIHGGPSIAGVTASWSEEGTPDVWPARQTEEEGEQSFPGSDSSTSAETPKNEPEPGKSPDPSPARTTASRSSKARTGKASSASSTAGHPADEPS